MERELAVRWYLDGVWSLRVVSNAFGVRCGCKEVDVETEVKQARWIRCESNRDGGRLNSAEKRNSVYQVTSNYIS